MNNHIYNQHAELLKQIASEEKESNAGDKPSYNEALNNALDSITRDLQQYEMREQISVKQFNLYCNWLESLTCRLHA
tara:strand:+ start:1899 stop:2129 length:231 start_codon:yes stop_codon:yes gene_type:complete